MTKATTTVNGIEITIVRGISLQTADWFARKNRVSQYGDRILAILKETEKAVYAIYGNICGVRKTMWIPKSVIREEKAQYEDFWSHVVTSDWGTAMAEINLEASMWR